MTDLSTTIAPKSTQLNADDLIAGPRTVTITKVTAYGEKDQPIAVHFDGDDGKPYLPCKSMRRLLVAVWGAQGAAYAGRSLTLYRDPKVKFGGIEVGGIRISHMSHIDGPQQIALTVTRGSRKPYTVQPIKASQSAGESAGADVRTADGAQGDSRTPPADDFPGDKPAFQFRVKDGRDRVHVVDGAEAWAAKLEGWIRAADGDAEIAAAVWEANRAFITEAEAAGHRHEAQRVWVAASQAGVDVDEKG